MYVFLNDKIHQVYSQIISFINKSNSLAHLFQVNKGSDCLFFCCCFSVCLYDKMAQVCVSQMKSVSTGFIRLYWLSLSLDPGV